MQCTFSAVVYFHVARSVAKNTQDAFLNEARNTSHLFAESFGNLTDADDMRDKLAELELSERFSYADFRGNLNGQPVLVGPYIKRGLAPREDFEIDSHDDHTYFVFVDINSDTGVQGQLHLGFDEQHLLNEIATFNQHWQIVSLTYLAISAALIFILSFTLTISMRTLRLSIKRIASGKHETSMLISAWCKEIADLSTDLETMRKRMIHSIRSEEHERSIVESIPLPIITLNADWNIMSSNFATKSLLGYENDELAGMSIKLLIAEADAPACEEFLRNTNSEKLEKINILDKNLNPVQITLRKAAIKTSHSSYVTLTLQQSSDEQQLSDFEYMALHDPLTGLMNRNFLLKNIDYLYDLTHPATDESVLLFIDLDRFKTINDTYGHSYGDLILQQIASRLTAAVRAHDVVIRLGGDEFCILLNRLKSVDDAIKVGNKLLNDISKIITIEGNEFILSGSIGVCRIPQDAPTPEDALKHGDIAMYNAKAMGGNRVCLFNTELANAAQRIMTMESLLRTALPNNEFFLLYQPKIDAKTGLIIGCEALLRWQSAALGKLVGPVEFIPIAESTGLICDLGMWVLKESIAQMKCWQDIGINQFEVSVNVSVRQIYDRNMISRLSNLLQTTRFDARHITLEITESMMMENADLFEQFMLEAKRFGFGLALDDFGTGYSSLSYLSRYQLDILKIDASFVRNMFVSEQNLSLIKAIISIARSLNMKTVAEGVETIEQAEFLIKENCDYLQGYYYAKPISATELTAKLLSQQTGAATSQM